jgi:hypothetical protein
MGMCPHRSATKRTIENVHCRLLFEEDPGTRDVLSTLLVEEEDRFGKTQEHILLIKNKNRLRQYLDRKAKRDTVEPYESWQRPRRGRKDAEQFYGNAEIAE